MVIKIAFIVGKTDDVYKYKVTSRKAPTWLKKGAKNPDFEEWVNEDNTVPSDVAMGMYIQHKYRDSEVTLLDGQEVAEDYSVSDLNEFDTIFTIYDAVEVFHCGGKKKTCLRKARRLERLLAKTKAYVYPPPDMHKYIIDKPNYYKDLKKSGIPIADFFGMTPTQGYRSPQKVINEAKRRGWNGFIVKPSYSAYNVGLEVFNNIDKVKPAALKRYYKKVKDLKFPNTTVQEFVPTFGKNYEIRMYFVNGKYSYALGTLLKKVTWSGEGIEVDDVTTFKSEGGKLSDSIKRKLIPVAKKAINSILKYNFVHPMIRVDFGCCLTKTKGSGKGCPKGYYFVNEIETIAANMIDYKTKFPAVQKIGDAAYRFAKKMKGKKNTKGRAIKSRKRIRRVCK